MAIVLQEFALLIDESLNVTGMDVTLQAYISYATKIFTSLLGEVEYNEATKDLIILNLAAHYHDLSANNGGLVENKVSTESSQQFRKVASDKVMFMATKFGQEAIALDHSNTLKHLSNQYSVKAVLFSV